MSDTDVIRAEIADVQSIVDDECWFEAERRGCAVDRHDPEVQKRVAEIILNGVGAYLRSKHLAHS
jgi:hypothetical protein